MFKVITYTTRAGKEIFKEWLAGLKDERAATKITVRLQRLETGNFGDHKSLGKGLYELRVNEGKGYRVYYTVSGKEIILLLCGGDKRTQSKDIEKAYEYLEDYKKNN